MGTSLYQSHSTIHSLLYGRDPSVDCSRSAVEVWGSLSSRGGRFGAGSSRPGDSRWGQTPLLPSIVPSRRRHELSASVIVLSQDPEEGQRERNGLGEGLSS